ncbi:uncharacterized protein LOC127587166 [Pristis pectinata]|uniref:uncharacterized protein LOC127587166 n=1 Tax=Pristis pectinata TaxID=685728 RepID=UPI00223DBEFC|nr:uncharacterized protein LOC127587166 [Pristis pectinata]
MGHSPLLWVSVAPTTLEKLDPTQETAARSIGASPTHPTTHTQQQQCVLSTGRIAATHRDPSGGTFQTHRLSQLEGRAAKARGTPPPPGVALPDTHVGNISPFLHRGWVQIPGTPSLTARWVQPHLRDCSASRMQLTPIFSWGPHTTTPPPTPLRSTYLSGFGSGMMPCHRRESSIPHHPPLYLGPRGPGTGAEQPAGWAGEGGAGRAGPGGAGRAGRHAARTDRGGAAGRQAVSVGQAARTGAEQPAGRQSVWGGLAEQDRTGQDRAAGRETDPPAQTIPDQPSSPSAGIIRQRGPRGGGWKPSRPSQSGVWAGSRLGKQNAGVTSRSDSGAGRKPVLGSRTRAEGMRDGAVPPVRSIIPRPNAVRSLVLCVWLLPVVAAVGLRGTCRFTRDTSSLSCPCVPTAEQRLYLHNLLGNFRDVCTRGEGDRICCRNTTQARVDAGDVLLNYSWVISLTVFCEIGDKAGSGCPRLGTAADHLSSPPPATSLEAVSAEKDRPDGGEARDATSGAAGLIAAIVMVVVGVCVAVVLVLWCFWKQRRGERCPGWNCVK